MQHVTKGGDEAIGEGGHVPHLVRLSGLHHLHCLREIHRDRFFAKDMLAELGGFDGHFGVYHVGSRNDDRLDVVALDDLAVIGRSDVDARLAPGLFQRGGVGVAECGDLRIRAERQAGEMVLQGDAPAANNRNSNSTHVLLAGKYGGNGPELKRGCNSWTALSGAGNAGWLRIAIQSQAWRNQIGRGG